MFEKSLMTVFFLVSPVTSFHLFFDTKEEIALKTFHHGRFNLAD